MRRTKTRGLQSKTRRREAALAESERRLAAPKAHTDPAFAHHNTVAKRLRKKLGK